VNHWPFIIAAYGVTGVGTVIVVWLSYAKMRAAEKKADEL
jgi:uncharacterized integral membrane protein